MGRREHGNVIRNSVKHKLLKDVTVAMDLIRRIGKIPRWNRYEPQIQHYSNFKTNITAAAIKIADVDRTFCTGRASFVYFECDEFGQLVNSDDEISTLYFKSILMYNALSCYNICIDLSWQVIWLYLSDFGLDLIYNKKLFDRYLNGCNLTTLNYQLTLAKENKIKDYVNGFFNSDLTQKVREKYNYYKHRGSFYVPGLGENFRNLPFSFENYDLKQFTRDEFDLNEWIEILIKFHWHFSKYFEEIISFVIPEYYLNQEMDFFSDTIGYGLLVEEYFKSDNNK